MSRNLRAVLLDWGGTLVDTCEPVYRAFARVCNVVCGIVTSGTRETRRSRARRTSRRTSFRPHGLRRRWSAPEHAADIGDSAEHAMMARAAGVFALECGTYPNDLECGGHAAALESGAMGTPDRELNLRSFC